MEKAEKISVQKFISEFDQNYIEDKDLIFSIYEQSEYYTLSE